MLLTSFLLSVSAPSESAVAVDTGIPIVVRKTCPIGGQQFDFTTTASYSTFGARMDGRPYGSWTFPLALPECPGNGLILYKQEFSADELTRLAALIQRPEYAAMREADTSYYRLAWLLREMGEPVENQLWMLTQATWQDEGGSVRRNRYLAELHQRIEAAPPGVGTAVGLAWRSRSVNALRELGRFEEASALLAATRTDAAAADAEENERRNWEGWTGQLDLLRRLVERRDSSIEPPEARPDRRGTD